MLSFKDLFTKYQLFNVTERVTTTAKRKKGKKSPFPRFFCQKNNTWVESSDESKPVNHTESKANWY